MYDIFYLPRFGRLLKKTLLERPVQMAGFTAAVLLIVFILYAVFHMPVWRWAGIQRMTFSLGLAGGGCLLASVVFNYFSVNALGTSYLTLPASHFEKWLCGILITGVLYPAVFLIFFRIMDVSFVAWYHNHLDPAKGNYQQLCDAVRTLSFGDRAPNDVYLLFLIFSGAMLTGSLYFNKAGFIKVAIAFCGFILFISSIALRQRSVL